MKPNAKALLFWSFFGALCLINADEFKPGLAFPMNSKSRADLPLSSFINQRTPTTDWSLVVLVRGEQHYTLNDKANRELLSQPVAQGDVVVLDKAAASFLSWRRQNPSSKVNLFWKSNPQLLDKALRPTSAATESASSTPYSDPLEPQTSRTSMNPTPSVQPPAPKKASDAKPTASTPSEEPTSSTPWSIMVVLSVAALGLLWLLFKRRS